MSRFFSLSTLILILAVFPADAQLASVTLPKEAVRQSAKSKDEGTASLSSSASPEHTLRQTVLTGSRNSGVQAQRFVLPGSNSVALDLPDSLSQSQIASARVAHAESFMDHPSLVMTEIQIPRSRRMRWRSCVRRTIQQGTNLNLEAILLLCAVSRDGRIQDLQYMVAPGRGPDSGSTMVVVVGGADAAAFDALVGASAPKPEALQAPVCPVGQFCNPCRLADPLNLGLIELRLHTDDGEARGSVTADMIALIRDYAIQMSNDGSRKRARTLNIGNQTVSIGHLSHVLDFERLTEGRAKFKAAGTLIDPFAMTVLTDPRREDPTFAGFTLSPPITLCMECPLGTKSNGIDDCLKDGVSVLYGTSTVASEQPCRGLTCWASCDSSCSNIEANILPKLEAEAARLPKERLLQATLRISELRRRLTSEQTLCRKNPEARTCVEAEYRTAHQMLAGVDLFQGEASRFCESSELEIPFPDGKPLNREQYLTCGPPKCIWGPSNFRYTGRREVSGCPNFLVERLIRQFQTEKWKSAKTAVCEEQAITEAEVARKLRSLGVDCMAYSSPKRTPQNKKL